MPRATETAALSGRCSPGHCQCGLPKEKRMPRSRKEPTNLRVEMAEMVLNLVNEHTRSSEEKINELHTQVQNLSEEMKKMKEDRKVARMEKHGETTIRNEKEAEAERRDAKVENESNALRDTFNKLAKIKLTDVEQAMKELQLDLEPNEVGSLMRFAEQNGMDGLGMDEVVKLVEEKKAQMAGGTVEDVEEHDVTPRRKTSRPDAEMTPEKDRGAELHAAEEASAKEPTEAKKSSKRNVEESHESEPGRKEEANEEEDDEDMPVWAGALLRKFGDFEAKYKNMMAQKENTKGR